jgi:hypothetical protein
MEGNLASLDPVDYALLLAGFCVHLLSLIWLFRKGALPRYFTLALYLCCSISAGVGRCIILHTAGFNSNTYAYFYFYSDALLIICLYFILMSLYSFVFEDMGVGKMVRAGAMLILAGTVGISYYMIAASSDRLVTRFVIELSQNLYFVGVVITYLLWGAMMKVHESRTRLIHLVLSLGVYVSLFATSFAFENLHALPAFSRYYFPLMDMWLPASWIYTFVRVPEDARMATASVVAPSR